MPTGRHFHEIRSNSDNLSLNSQQLSASSEDLSKGASNQAASIEYLATEVIDISGRSLELSQQVDNELLELLPRISESTEMMQEIAASSVEQTTGISQVNQTVQSLNEITQQNASSSEEMAASAEELAAQAEALNETVSFFKVKDSA